MCHLPAHNKVPLLPRKTAYAKLHTSFSFSLPEFSFRGPVRFSPSVAERVCVTRKFTAPLGIFAMLVKHHTTTYIHKERSLLMSAAGAQCSLSQSLPRSRGSPVKVAVCCACACFFLPLDISSLQTNLNNCNSLSLPQTESCWGPRAQQVPLLLLLTSAREHY